MKVFVSHDHEDTKACAPLLRTLDAWGVNYYFGYAEDIFGQQLSDRVQAELAQSQVLIRVCTRATPRSYWMSIESGAFMGLIADEHRAGRSARRIVTLILDPAYQREPFDVTTTVVDATDTAHPQWVNTLRAALGLPPLHDLAEVARGIYSPPPAGRMSRRAVIGLGAAGVVVLAAVGAGGLALYERGKSPPTTIGSGTPTPPTQDPSLKWSFFAGDLKNLSGASITATPVLDSGTLYIATQQGTFYALDPAAGMQQWQFNPGTPGQVYLPFAVANGVIYALVKGIGLVAVSDEKAAWSDQIDTFNFMTPTLAGGRLYVNGYKYAFVGVVDADTGHDIQYLNPASSTIGVSAPTVTGNLVVCGGQDGYLYALDATKPGPELWRAETGAAKDQQLNQQNAFYVSATPSIADGIVYVGSLDNSVYALDARSGAKLWNFPTNDQIAYSSPTPVNGVICVGSNDKSLYALDAQSGKLVWRYATGDKINGTPTVVDGIVYIGSYDKYVHAVDATTGQLVRKYFAGGKVFAQPVVADGVLYAATTTGWVLAFRLS